MEQLRKAGVIVTPVPPIPKETPQPQEPPAQDQNDSESVKSSEVQEQTSSRPSSSLPESAPFDPNSVDEFPSAFDNKNTEEDEEGQMVLIDEEEPTPEKKRPGRKRGKRKPIELNPEMLRPKRPRRAKERHEEEEKPKETPKKVEPPPTPTTPAVDGETPVKKKRGRKPKALLLQVSYQLNLTWFKIRTDANKFML